MTCTVALVVCVCRLTADLIRYGLLLVEQRNQMPCQLPICLLINLVQDQVDEVKAGQQAGGQLDVVYHAHTWVVAAAHRIG